MQKFNQVSDISQETPPPPPTPNGNSLGSVVTGANILVSGVLIAAMYYDSRSATAAVLSGVGYFTLSTGLTLLTLSGTLGQIVTNGQNQKTIRQLHQLQHRRQPQVSLVDPLQIGYSEPQAQPRLGTFVAPVADMDDSAKREAVAWLLQLYGTDGEPDPSKVLLETDREKPGRVRIGGPSKAAKQWLLDRHIIHSLGNGYRLNLARYPNIVTVRQFLSTAHGGGGSPTHPLPMTTTLASGGGDAL